MSQRDRFRGKALGAFVLLVIMSIAAINGTALAAEKKVRLTVPGIV